MKNQKYKTSMLNLIEHALPDSETICIRCGGLLTSPLHEICKSESRSPYTAWAKAHRTFERSKRMSEEQVTRERYLAGSKNFLPPEDKP